MYAAASNLTVLFPSTILLYRQFILPSSNALFLLTAGETEVASRGSWRAWEAAQSGVCTYGLQTCVPGRRVLALCGPEGLLLPSRAAGSPDFKGGQRRSKKDYCSEVLWDAEGSEAELASLLIKAPA